MTPEEKVIVEREMEESHQGYLESKRKDQEMREQWERVWENPESRAKMEETILEQLKRQSHT